jgi:hypothetical protein
VASVGAIAEIMLRLKAKVRHAHASRAPLCVDRRLMCLARMRALECARRCCGARAANSSHSTQAPHAPHPIESPLMLDAVCRTRNECPLWRNLPGERELATAHRGGCARGTLTGQQACAYHRKTISISISNKLLHRQYLQRELALAAMTTWRV